MATNQPPAPDVNSALGQIIARSDWRQALVNDYAETATRLQQAYGRILPDLQARSGALVDRISKWVTDNPQATLTQEYVRGFKEYQDLLARVEVEMQDFAALLKNEAGIVEVRAMDAGAQSALELAQAVSVGAGEVVAAAWNRVAPEALAQAVGYVDSPAFKSSIATFGENASANLGDVILAGIAQGKGPGSIANILTNWYSIPSAWASSTVRTLQMYSYRGASHESYKQNSDVVTGWMWWADLFGACPACVALHGSIHSLDETLNDHHNGECLVPGQMITTSTGLKPIEHVQVGDYVLTHLGRYRKVTGVYNRDYDGAIVDIKGLQVTPEHPVYTSGGWIASKDLSADSILLMLNPLDARVSKWITVHPRLLSINSLRLSASSFLPELCQRGSYSTAIIHSGNAKSILNVSTANCGTGFNPLSLRMRRKRNSPLLQNVFQLASRHWARFLPASGVCPARTRRAIFSGSFPICRRTASVPVIGSIFDNFISFINDLVLIPASVVNSRYVAFSSTYRRESHRAIGSPNRTSKSCIHWECWLRPTSTGLRLGRLSALRLWYTARKVLFFNWDAISPISMPDLSSAINNSSSSADQGLPVMSYSYNPIGNSIHQQLYLGKVYDLTVDEDHSFFANGIAVHNCTELPIVAGTSWADSVTSGEDWFADQPESYQREILGAGRYELYKNDMLDWSIVSQPYENDLYGTMRREATLAELGV